ncbi:hypothetical protein NS226_02125 [Aureimonas ureilytica]|uniref:Protein nucleotidyltransferase YdiU n=1 Tax=Aureimonas ureilytica TaxID=401562 RepID=A0A175RD69_9HYPH|nr:YdiU family protein [Aureimonas ureilytica]KTQ97936.1 hypothetical protein NS226_02125 [Aureimonas ureilytica]
MTAHFNFDNRYARLGVPFHRPTSPTPVAAPLLLKLNHGLARELGFDVEALESAEGAEVLAGNRIAAGSEPIATAYAGHQFGNFVPQLGDGRAVLLGEIIDRHGARRDLQLKGAGPTPYSRGGDGRAGLGPVLREYLVSEAMAALGIPTTRALAAVATGEWVMRDRPLPGAVLTRVASSHIRVGTFQFFAARRDEAALRRLADHVIERHYPDAAGSEHPYRALLDGVCARQAALVARWMQVGFVHGVMNTDNMSIAGETIDYGPCAFLDAYDPATVFSSIDRNGRYAYANQPGIASWNLARLAECLLDLLDPDENRAVEIAQDSLAGFATAFHQAYLDGFRRKIGLTQAREGDDVLVQDWLGLMAREKADFTRTFRALGRAAEGDETVLAFADADGFGAWATRWRARLDADALDPGQRRAQMDRVNPAIIPRNHHVEAALAAAMEGDFAPFETLNAALAEPYGASAEGSVYAALPPRADEPYRTFCGT